MENLFNEFNSQYINDSFIFRVSDNLSYVCNAPSFASGFYLIYAFEKGNYNLIYIGISGLEDNKGVFKHRKGGLRGRFLTGKQFGERRQIAWSKKMESENIDHLKVKWFITYDDVKKDVPRNIERNLLKKYFDLNLVLPRWNSNF